MIVGIGIDLVDKNRIKYLFSTYRKKFIEKYFLHDENLHEKSSYLANNFATKEAFSKAIGTGFRYPCYPNYIGVSRDELGKPIIILNKKLNNFIKGKFGDFNIHTSITDNKEYSIAFVVIEN